MFVKSTLYQTGSQYSVVLWKSIVRHFRFQEVCREEDHNMVMSLRFKQTGEEELSHCTLTGGSMILLPSLIAC